MQGYQEHIPRRLVAGFACWFLKICDELVFLLLLLFLFLLSLSLSLSSFWVSIAFNIIFVNALYVSTLSSNVLLSLSTSSANKLFKSSFILSERGIILFKNLSKYF